MDASDITSDGAYYSALFLRNARSHIDSVLEYLQSGGRSSDEIRRRLSEVIALSAKAWHVRGISQSDFDALSLSAIQWMRVSIPDLGPALGDLSIVPMTACVHDLPDWRESH